MAFTDYKTVSAAITDPDRLQADVGAAIASGWQPLGAPATSGNRIVQAMVKGTAGGGDNGSTEVTAADITDATETGRSVLTAEDAAAARSAIGAGTSSLQIGTTASTAMAGNTPIPAAPTWSNIDGKPAVVAEGANAAEARAAIGAGTSNLELGTTAGTALAGNTVIPPAYTLPAAGAAIGGVKIAAAVADAVDEADAVTQLNALLASLRASGALAS